jgi:hypothetical protein
MRYVISIVIVLALWALYLELTGWLVYQVYLGDPRHLFQHYRAGDTLAWIFLGWVLWELTGYIEDA